MTKKHVRTGAPWEVQVGYSRAVRCGSHIAVSGTTAVDAEGKIMAKGDAYRQAKRCIEIIAEGLRGAGASLEDVVRTRLYVTNIDDWEAVGRAHQEAFQRIRPATTMVEVARLIDGEMLVEIEADARIDDA